jgi:hypothetical protein
LFRRWRPAGAPTARATAGWLKDHIRGEDKAFASFQHLAKAA